MVHFTLSKFKKAGQLAFLAGFIFVLPSCGGGGGGGNPTPTQPAIIEPVFTYNTGQEFSQTNISYLNGTATFEAATAITNKFSFDSQAYHTRVNSLGNNFCAYKSTTSTNTRLPVSNPIGAEATVSYGAQTGATVCENNAYAGADVSSYAMKLRTENISFSPPASSSDTGYSFSGPLSGYLEYDLQRWGLTDEALNEIAWIGTRVSESMNSSEQGNWSGATYVYMELGEIDYGTSCNYSTSPRKCSSFSEDSNYNADIAGQLVGFKTFSGDMPSSGTASYRTFSIGVGAYGMNDFLNAGVGNIFTTGCGSSPNYAECHLAYLYSAAGEQPISIDFAAKTISGTLSFQRHYSIYDDIFYPSINELTDSSYDVFKATLENFSFSGTISGNAFTGTISNTHFSGTIIGSFYGPQASEIGAIIRVDADNVSGSDYATSGAHGIFTFLGKKN